MTFAGLWDRWKMNDQELVTCTIITTRANKMISPIHERMPVILDEEARRTWLDHTITDPSITLTPSLCRYFKIWLQYLHINRLFV